MTRVTMKMTTLREVSSACLQPPPINCVRHIGSAAFDVVEQHRADAKDMSQPRLGQMALVYSQLPERLASAPAVSRRNFDETEAATEIAGADGLTAAIGTAEHGQMRPLVVTTGASFGSHAYLPPWPASFGGGAFIVLADFSQG
jgi:hypothetical protein